MADISKITIESGTYNIKDVTARNSVTSLQNIINNKRILVFGDSWVAHANSVIVDNCWIYDVAKGLGILNIDCYAKAGAKISTSNINRVSLISQVQDAINEISESNRDQYEYAFIMGGVNDYHDSNITNQMFESGLYTALSTLKTAFPKTKVVLIGMNCFYERVGNDNRFKNFINLCNNACQNLGDIIYLGGLSSMFRLFGQSVYRPNDDSSYVAGGGTYHPNNTGNKIIAQWILKHMLGNQNAIPITFTALESFTILEQWTVSDGKHIYWHIKFTAPNGLTSGFHKLGVAKWSDTIMVLSDKHGDMSVLPAIQGIVKQSKVISNNICAFVPEIGTTNFNQDCNLMLYNGATLDQDIDICIDGVSTIMEAY